MLSHFLNDSQKSLRETGNDTDELWESWNHKTSWMEGIHKDQQVPPQILHRAAQKIPPGAWECFPNIP